MARPESSRLSWCALLQHQAGEELGFVIRLRFASLDAGRAFAGPEPEAAVVPPKAPALPPRYDRRSAHYSELPVPTEPGQTPAQAS